MSLPSVYAWQDELSAVEYQAALDAAKQDAERVTAEFVETLPADSPAYDAEWTTRYGSKDRLIFEFSVVLDLDGHGPWTAAGCPVRGPGRSVRGRDGCVDRRAGGSSPLPNAGQHPPARAPGGAPVIPGASAGLTPVRPPRLDDDRNLGGG